MIKKNFYFTFLFAVIGLTTSSFGQYTAPDIAWQRCIGGTKTDQMGKIIQIVDGNYILAGWTTSIDGDITCQQGTSVLVVMKLMPDGDISWQRCFEYHSARGLYATNDGGFIIVGHSSVDDCGTNHGNADAWIVKMDTHGEIEWQRCFGGTDSDMAWAMDQTSDDGFVLVCQTTSNDGDVFGNHGGTDVWIVKLDAAAEIQWQKCLGGTNTDDARDIQQTQDGGYILALQTQSDDGDVSGLHGDVDFWVVRLDAAGEIQWQKCLGGTSEDYAQKVFQLSDGGFLLSGFSSSIDGDVTGNIGGHDYWVVKLDSGGEFQWQKSYGGTKWDFNNYSAIKTIDGGFIIAGQSASDDGDLSENKGYHDVWLMKIDTAGSLQWQRTYGGTYPDGAHDIQQTFDGGYIMLGYTQSNDGDVSGFNGGMDFWVVKLDGETVAVQESGTLQNLRIYPSPNQGYFTIESDDLHADIVELALFNVDGRIVRSESVKNLNGSLDHVFECGDAPSGLYLLRVGTGMNTAYMKVVVRH